MTDFVTRASFIIWEGLAEENDPSNSTTSTGNKPHVQILKVNCIRKYFLKHFHFPHFLIMV